VLASTSLPEAVPPTGGWGAGAVTVGCGVGVGFTGPRVFTGLGLADAVVDALVVGAALVDAAAVAAAEFAAALPAAADPGAEAAELDAAGLGARLPSAELAPADVSSAELAELWWAEWLQAALRPASAAIMVAVTAVLGVRLMLHHRLGESRSEAFRGLIWAS